MLLGWQPDETTSFRTINSENLSVLPVPFNPVVKDLAKREIAGQSRGPLELFDDF